MQAPVLQFSVTTDSRAFELLRETWTALWRRTAHPHIFSSFDWCWNSWNLVARGRGHRLRLVIGRLEDKVVLIWPLMLDDRVLRMLSSETLEYRDVLVDGSEHAPAWIDQAWAFAASALGADVFILQNLRQPNALSGTLARLSTTVPIGGAWCPVIRLDQFGSWEAYAAILPKSLMGDQRRQWKRIQREMSGVSFDLLERREMIQPTIDWIRQHKLVWAATRENKRVWFSSDDKSQFLQAVVEAALIDGSLVFGILSAMDTIVSGYVSGNEFLFHVFAYDSTFATYSPSRLLLGRLVQHCFDRGVHTFDFMPGDESYKRIWATDYIRTDSFAGPLSTRGAWLFKLAKWKTPPSVTRTTTLIRDILPAPLRRHLHRRLRIFRLVEYAMRLESPAPPPQLRTKRQRELSLKDKSGI